MQRNHAMSAVSQRDLEAQMRCVLPHLTEGDVRALACIVERLAEAYGPDRIYLFGSKARGNYGPDSDFDLMVVVPDDAPHARNGVGLPMSGCGGPAQRLMSWCGRVDASRAAHIYGRRSQTILREGRLLYAA